jgi:hypothetical protein
VRRKRPTRLAASGGAERDAERLLRDVGAILEGHFQLSSGRHSGVFVEKFRLLERPTQTSEVCRMVADWAQVLGPQVVAGPTTGGIIVSYEVARHLGLRSIFAESDDGAGRSSEGSQSYPASGCLWLTTCLQPVVPYATWLRPSGGRVEIRSESPW